MKKFAILMACIFMFAAGAGRTFAIEVLPVKLLPAIVAQSAGQANTVVMWHDINDDGIADFKASYVFKNGKLHLLGKIQTPPAKSVRQLNER